MADYQSTVELILNGLEKLKQAEDRIKGLDGKNVKIKFDVDSSGIKKVQDSLKQSFGGVGGGVGGGVTSSKATANMTKGVRGYFNEYNKAIKKVISLQKERLVREKKHTSKKHISTTSH